MKIWLARPHAAYTPRKRGREAATHPYAGAPSAFGTSWQRGRLMIHVICPRCQKRFSTSDANAGKTGRCPQCGNPIRVPSPGPAPAGAPSPGAAAPPAAQPAAVETAQRAVPAGGEVRMGQVFLWVGEGM